MMPADFPLLPLMLFTAWWNGALEFWLPEDPPHHPDDGVPELHDGDHMLFA
ncbi:hypothetical protein [Stakelama marina]|uniref:Uncharacterized protein n=1 Tax=Stakelama marina TaxID=2826939 RepID=A0A8T4IE62_9SPHN|nr:hypothetical protein [Stakelama marina]MBR0551275.1 hypothetical protein [Stakelama marina]